jgi:hypothetical protein
MLDCQTEYFLYVLGLAAAILFQFGQEGARCWQLVQQNFRTRDSFVPGHTLPPVAIASGTDSSCSELPPSAEQIIDQFRGFRAIPFFERGSRCESLFSLRAPRRRRPVR